MHKFYKFSRFIYGVLIALLFFVLLYIFLLVTAPYGSYESDYRYSNEFPNNQI